jgi:hypothetical protein
MCVLHNFFFITDQICTLGRFCIFYKPFPPNYNLNGKFSTDCQWTITNYTMGTYYVFRNSFSLPRWLSEMGCFRFAKWGLHETSRIRTDNPTCTLSLTLEIPLMLTLEPPSVNTGQFPLKVPSPGDQPSSKMAVMRFLIETALIFNFPQMTR